MNHYGIQANSFGTAGEEIKETVVCPKPRRVGRFNPAAGGLAEPFLTKPLKWHACYHQELFDLKAGNELLDIVLLAKCGDQSPASPPPFFSGSPPSRVSNPLIQDDRFGDDKYAPMLPSVISGLPPSPRKGGCTRASFGNNPAVRVEGFDCLDIDRRGCSIPALA